MNSRMLLVGLLLVCCTVCAQSKKTVLDYLKAIPTRYLLAPFQKLDIDTLDLEHGFIAFSPKEFDGQGEFKLWNGRNGDIIGVTTFVCGPVCGVNTVFFLDPQRHFRDVTAKVLPSLARDALFRAYRRDGGRLFETTREFSYSLRFDQKGTGISVIDGDPLRYATIGHYTFNGLRFSLEINH
jgi:hypothetical protein